MGILFTIIWHTLTSSHLLINNYYCYIFNSFFALSFDHCPSGTYSYLPTYIFCLLSTKFLLYSFILSTYFSRLPGWNGVIYPFTVTCIWSDVETGHIFNNAHQTWPCVLCVTVSTIRRGIVLGKTETRTICEAHNSSTKQFHICSMCRSSLIWESPELYKEISAYWTNMVLQDPGQYTNR